MKPVKLVKKLSIKSGCSMHAVADADGWLQEYRVEEEAAVVELEAP